MNALSGKGTTQHFFVRFGRYQGGLESCTISLISCEKTTLSLILCEKTKKIIKNNKKNKKERKKKEDFVSLDGTVAN